MKGERNILSWAAGLFDADGCFTMTFTTSPGTKQYPYLMASATLDMREEVSADIFQSLFGGTKAKKVRKNRNHSTTYSWRASRKVLDAFLVKIRPHIILKGAQADLIARMRLVRAGKASKPITAQEYEALKACKNEMTRLNEKGVGKANVLDVADYVKG